MRADNYSPAVKHGARWYPDNVVIAPPSAGDYIFVDGNKSTGGSGNSWADAYSTIEDGTTAGSTGDVIMIAPKDTNGYYAENVRVGPGTSNTADEYGKTGMHIMGVTNNLKEVRISATNTATADKHAYTSLASVSITATCMFITCAGIEVSNLCFDGESTCNGIYWGDGSRPFGYTGQTDAQNGSVHDCTFKMGYSGIDFDGASNDKHVYRNYFYKQADQGIYIGPGGLQQSSRIHVYDNFFTGCENYGVFIYNHAQNKNHCIGPNNVFMDQASGTAMTNPVISANTTCTNAIVGNYMACANDHSMGTNVYGSGNYVGNSGTAEHVAED